MAADFNAGSIEGSLELNTAPFAAGLAKARAQAADFEAQKIAPKVSADTAEFTAKKDKTTTELDRLGAKKAEPKVGLDTTEFLAKYAIVKRLLNPGGLSGDGKGIFGLSLGTAKIVSMVGGVMALAAAAGPATAVVAGFGGAAAAAFGGAALSLGLFAKVVTSDFGIIDKALKAGTQLTGQAGVAETALKGLHDAWAKFQQAAGGPGFKVLIEVFRGLTGVLPKLVPLLRTTGQGVAGIVHQVFALTKTPLFDKFLTSLQHFMQGFLGGAGPVLANLLKTFMGAFIALQPLMAILGHGIERLSAASAHFANGGGLAKFVGYVQSALPPVMGLIVGLVHALLNIGKGLAPLAGPALGFLTALVHAIGHIHLGPLAHGFGDLFTSLKPLLPILAHLINVLLKPIGHLLSSIANGPVHTLTHGLKGELRPAFKALHGILHDLVKPLSEFMGSIANLANPTGVHLVTKLLQGLQKVVHILVGPVGKLAVALESVVDNGINAIIPVLPGLAKGLGIVASALVPVVDGLAGILANKTVVDILLGVAGAVWLGVKAFQAYKLAVEALAFVQGLLDAIAFGWVGLSAAELEASASTDISTASLAAQKVALIASGIASKIFAGGMALVNAVMDANPIVLVVLAVAALAAGLIYAYKHSQTFRNIVNGAFHAVAGVAKSVFNWLTGAVTNIVDFIRQHWQLLLGILTGPIGAAVIFLITHWDTIRNGFTTLMHDVENAVSSGISNVVGWFTALPGKLLGLVGQMVNAGKALMGGIFHGLESAASTVGSFAANIASSIWHALEGVLNNILPHTLRINKGPIHINVPLFPMLAAGGVTNGPTLAGIGDNPGGREAVVPLDKYDLPKRGDVATIAGRAAADNAQIISLLAAIAHHLSTGSDQKTITDALAEAVTKHSAATMRAMTQIARAT